MKLKISLFILFIALATQVSAESVQRFVLRYDGEVFRGQSTIYLKREIRNQHPHMRLRNLHLERVVVVAKSARGNGLVYLQTGAYRSREELIDGNRHDFLGQGQYFRIPFSSPRSGLGPWQLHLRGKIKIKKIIVIVSGRGGGHGFFVTRRCGYVLEYVWGKDLDRFFATASGRIGSGVMSRACEKAKRKCRRARRNSFLTRCVKL